MVRNKWSWPLIAALALVVALGAASCGGGGNDNNSASGTTTSSSDHSDVLAALVSDIGKFDDRSFNQSPLEGLNKAKTELGVKTGPLQSNQVSDYIPNLTSARAHERATSSSRSASCSPTRRTRSRKQVPGHALRDHRLLGRRSRRSRRTRTSRA